MKYKDIPDIKKIERFTSKICIVGECHEWTGYVDKHGYGEFKINNKNYKAHRVAFHIYKKLDNTMLVDHMCRNRKCVNPEHLRLVDTRTNAIENNSGIVAVNYLKKACKRGHEYMEGSYKIYKDGSRTCIICKRINAREFYERHKT